jgi:hypothetical protein
MLATQTGIIAAEATRSNTRCTRRPLVQS